MYEVIFSDKALKQFNKLEKNTRSRIVAVLERIRVRPEAHLKKLVGDPSWRLRVGDYRLIIDIDRGRLMVLIIAVGHRKNIYK